MTLYGKQEKDPVYYCTVVEQCIEEISQMREKDKHEYCESIFVKDISVRC